MEREESAEYEQTAYNSCISTAVGLMPNHLIYLALKVLQESQASSHQATSVIHTFNCTGQYHPSHITSSKHFKCLPKGMVSCRQDSVSYLISQDALYDVPL